jgi:hypothetical protein
VLLYEMLYGITPFRAEVRPSFQRFALIASATPGYDGGGMVHGERLLICFAMAILQGNAATFARIRATQYTFPSPAPREVSEHARNRRQLWSSSRYLNEGGNAWARESLANGRKR